MVKFASAQTIIMKDKPPFPLPRIEYKVVSDRDKRPRNCIACESDHLIIRGHQYHDMEDIGTPTFKRVLRHEKITWECKACGTKFMLVNPDVPHDTEYTDDVKAYALKRVLGKGDAANRVAADLHDLHNVGVTPQAIGEWVKREREKTLPGPAGSAGNGGTPGEPAKGDPAPVLTLDGTFKAATTKKNAGAPGTSGAPSWLHLTRLKDGRLAAFWLPGSARKRSRSS